MASSTIVAVSKTGGKNQDLWLHVVVVLSKL